MATGPLVAIVGPTASGKTALAIDLAKKFNGEIICADSRTVFKGMDIGTAKPSVPERQGITHHLLDVVRPDQPFNVTDFKKLAEEAIADIESRGKLPIMVGGSGLYIDSVIYNYQFRPVNTAVREEFANASIDELQAELKRRGIELPENCQNPRYLLRSLEAGLPSSSHTKLRPKTLLIGLQVDPEILKNRITQRIESMVNAGLIDELRGLAKAYDWSLPAMQVPAYKAFRDYVEGRADLDQAKANFATHDSQLAKKQRTWFKRNKGIQWMTDPSKSVDIVTTFLNTWV